jgi:hypothetical protein
VFSRNGRDWTDRVPLIAEELAKLRVKSVTLDGEGVVCRPDGVTDFDKLRAAVGRLGSRDAFGTLSTSWKSDCEDPRRYERHVRQATLRSLIKRPCEGDRRELRPPFAVVYPMDDRAASTLKRASLTSWRSPSAAALIPPTLVFISVPSFFMCVRFARAVRIRSTCCSIATVSALLGSLRCLCSMRNCLIATVSMS